VASNHQLIDVCRRNGYPMEFKRNFDGSEDYNSMIVSFPYAYPEGTVLAKEMTALDQLGWIRRLQEDWSDNSVSCTIYYKKEEIPAIREYLSKYYHKNHKSLSFLLHSDHGFAQAPYEEITKEQYDELVSVTTIITSVNEELEFDGGDECAAGACPVR
jgi:hypothetical protein